MKVEGIIKERHRKILKALILVFVCLLTFVYCWYYMNYLGRDRVGSYSPDETNYIAMAQRFLTEHIYSFWGDGSDAYVSPGYPMFLVICMRIFGMGADGIFCIRVVQSLLAVLTVFLTYCLARLLFDDYYIGIIASGLIALNSSFAEYSQRILTETIYFFMMMLFAVLFVYANKKEKKRVHFLAGIIFGVTVMIRPLIIIIAPFMYIAFLVKNWKEKKKIVWTVFSFVAGFVIVCGPWWIRNVIVLHECILLATQTNPIYAGLAPDVVALGLEDPGSMLGNIKLLLELLIEYPLQTIYWMIVRKFDIIFLERYAIDFISFTGIIQDITVYLGLLGSCVLLRVERKRWLSLTFFVYLASSFLFIPVARYALQYLPFLAIFTGFILREALCNKKLFLRN